MTADQMYPVAAALTHIDFRHGGRIAQFGSEPRKQPNTKGSDQMSC